MILSNIRFWAEEALERNQETTSFVPKQIRAINGNEHLVVVYFLSLLCDISFMYYLLWLWPPFVGLIVELYLFSFIKPLFSETQEGRGDLVSK